MRLIAICLALLALPASADSGFRNTDVRLDQHGLTELIAGKVLEFHDGGKSHYGVNNTYVYTYIDDGPEWRGTYRVLTDSQVCVEFENGMGRCDHIVINGKNPVLITRDLERFPIRNMFVYVE